MTWKKINDDDKTFFVNEEVAIVAKIEEEDLNRDIAILEADLADLKKIKAQIDKIK